MFICALGDVTYKKLYCDIILSRGGKFISLISKSAIIEQNVNFGDGCIIFGGVRICCDTSIGSFNTFQSYVVIGHDVIIGSGCHFNTFSFLGGFVKISDLVTVQTGAIIHPHKILNKRCVIGAGAVVLRNVPAQTTVYGNPAIKLKI